MSDRDGYRLLRIDGGRRCGMVVPMLPFRRFRVAAVGLRAAPCKEQDTSK